MTTRRDCWAWQWFAWRAPHQYTTQSIWRPATAPFRLRAWQPDVSGWTLARFNFDTMKWARDRGVSPTAVVFDLNNGSTSI